MLACLAASFYLTSFDGCHLLMSIDTSHCCDPCLPYNVLEYFPWMIEVDTVIELVLSALTY
jgi:hypothetical protein